MYDNRRPRGVLSLLPPSAAAAIVTTPSAARATAGGTCVASQSLSACMLGLAATMQRTLLSSDSRLACVLTDLDSPVARQASARQLRTKLPEATGCASQHP